MKWTRLQFDRILLYLTGTAVAILLLFIIKKEFSRPEIAFVNIGRLVDGYRFKKDLEAASGEQLNKIRYVIDSLQMVQKVSGEDPQLAEQVSRVEHVFQEYYVQANQDITKKIWDRLNPLMEQYGKENSLALLIGANGAGTVLYGARSRDITEELLQYINRKYETGS